MCVCVLYVHTVYAINKSTVFRRLADKGSSWCFLCLDSASWLSISDGRKSGEENKRLCRKWQRQKYLQIVVEQRIISKSPTTFSFVESTATDAHNWNIRNTPSALIEKVQDEMVPYKKDRVFIVSFTGYCVTFSSGGFGESNRTDPVISTIINQIHSVSLCLRRLQRCRPHQQPCPSSSPGCVTWSGQKQDTASTCTVRSLDRVNSSVLWIQALQLTTQVSDHRTDSSRWEIYKWSWTVFCV